MSSDDNADVEATGAAVAEAAISGNDAGRRR
jgi:hypothetical protein